MTNPQGKMFISYKHSQQPLAEGLELALREHGVPVWRDVHEIGPDPLEKQIREDLADPNLAGGIAVVSEDVTESPIILEVELPALRERCNDEDFFVVVALCPGLGHTEAKTILAQADSFRDFSHWFMESIEVESDGEEPTSILDHVVDAVTSVVPGTQRTNNQSPAFDQVVTAVLERRLQRVESDLSDDQPIDCTLDTYPHPSYEPQFALNIDWSPHFNGTIPEQSIWNNRLLPSLRQSVDYLQDRAPGRELRFRGRAHLPAAFSLGHCLQESRGIAAAWLQGQQSDFTPWRIDMSHEESGLQCDFEPLDTTASHLAVMVSIVDDVRPEVGRVKLELPPLNGMVEFRLEQSGEKRLDAPKSSHIAHVFEEQLRDVLNRVSKTSMIHLFMATPVGLAFLLGQKTNTLPPIQTYCLGTTDSGRAYEPAALLK